MLDVDIQEKSYGAAHGSVRRVLLNISFQVGAEEFVCLTGPSGCGKTTILRIVLGLEPKFDGSTILNSQKPQIGVVFQEPRLLPWRTLDQNVRLALGNVSHVGELDDLYNELGLEGHLKAYPGELSGGLARRAALARAFAVDPSMLVLDEPFVSLDAETANRLRRLLLKVWRSRPTPVLMVTHDINEALALADRILVMSSQPGPFRGEFLIPLPRDERSPETLGRLKADYTKMFPPI